MTAESFTGDPPDWRELPVLVTGGAGFIGSHLVDELVARGARVRVLDDLSTGSPENLAHLGAAVELVEGDVRDAAACRRAAEGVRLVFHQAALGSVPRSMADPATTVAVNVSGTANVFAAARDAGARRVVYASSSSVYGDSDRLPKREGEEGRPLSPYALSKAMDEELARVFAACFGQELLGLRYFNVYGPRQSPEGPYAAVVPGFFAACRAGLPARIHGDGEQSRDFTYVADAVRANLLAAAAPAAACGRAYNVAGGRRTTINELAREIRSLVGSGPVPVHAEPRPGDVRHSAADLTAAGQALGYRPEVELREGLERTARAFGRPARRRARPRGPLGSAAPEEAP
jgi:nucleoside-diphosphate-sugar epimerase